MSLSVNYPTTRPSLLLDFLNTQVLDPRITFTRASSATYFDAAGVLRSAPAGQARFDYNPSTLTPLGLLIEEQRTNSIRNNTMQGAVAGTPGTLPTNWSVPNTAGLTTNVIGLGTQSGVTYIDVQVVGTSNATAYTLTQETTTQIAALVNQVWTFSSWVSLVAGSFANVTSAFVDIRELNSAGSQVNSGAVSISLPTSSFQRIFASRTNTDAITAFVQPRFRFVITNGADIDFTLRIGLPQLELGAFATSVIPTETVAVTRNADAASMTGVNFSSWYNAGEGTLYGESTTQKPTTSGTVYAVAIDDGTTNNFISPLRFSGSDIRGRVDSGAVIQAQMLTIGVYTVNVFYKSAIGYMINDFAVSTNGTLGPLDNSGSIPTTVNRLSIGALASLANTGHIRKLSYYPFRLTNAQLQALTS